VAARIPTIVVPGTYNAKTLPLGRPDVAAVNYGVTTRNVSRRLEKLWAHRAEKAGGSKQIFDKIAKWASPEEIRRRGGNPADRQWQLWGEYLRTGKIDSGLRPQLQVTALGLGLSETARHQQHKKGFLDTFVGKLVSIGAMAATAWVGGPWAAAAVGGGLGWVKDHSLLGVATGALQGYSIGQATMWAQNGGFSSLFNPANGAGITATGGGTGLANFLTNVGTQIGGNIGAGTLLGGAITAAGLVAGGGRGGGRTGGGRGLLGNGPAVSPQDVIDAAGNDIDKQRDAVTRPVVQQRASAETLEARSARRMSLLATGAHTGAGDPRRVSNFKPKARPIDTPSGRIAIPVARAA